MANLGNAPALAHELLLIDEKHRDFIAGRSAKLSSRSAFGTLFNLMFVLLFVGIAAFVTYVSVSEFNLSRAISTRGVPVTATVTNLEIDDSDDSTNYYVSFRYRAGDKFYDTNQSINSKLYYSLKQGGPLPVRYLPDAPETVEIVAAPRTVYILTGIIAGILWTLIIAGLLLALFGENFWAAFQKDGQIIIGQITEYNAHTDSDNDYSVRFGYSFTRPDGTIQTVPMPKRLSQTRNHWEKFIPKPGVGSRVAVAYLPSGKHKLL